jgi:predicted deacylase
VDQGEKPEKKRQECRQTSEQNTITTPKTNKGDTIAIVTDPYGKYEKKVRASMSGYVICVNESPVVYKGDAIFHIGKEKV